MLAPTTGSLFLPTTDGFALGTWLLSADRTQILGSTRMVLARIQSGAQLGEPVRWLVLGDTDLGYSVPEPTAAALVLVAGAGLAARARQRTATER